MALRRRRDNIVMSVRDGSQQTLPRKRRPVKAAVMRKVDQSGFPMVALYVHWALLLLRALIQDSSAIAIHCDRITSDSLLRSHLRWHWLVWASLLLNKAVRYPFVPPLAVVRCSDWECLRWLLNVVKHQPRQMIGFLLRPKPLLRHVLRVLARRLRSVRRKIQRVEATTHWRLVVQQVLTVLVDGLVAVLGECKARPALLTLLLS